MVDKQKCGRNRKYVVVIDHYDGVMRMRLQQKKEMVSLPDIRKQKETIPENYAL